MKFSNPNCKILIVDTYSKSDVNHCHLKDNNNLIPRFNGQKERSQRAISTYSSDAIDKGYGRVSKGLIILCVFVGCTSLFLYHTRRDLPCSNLNNDGEAHSRKTTTSQSKDKTSFPFNENNQPLSSGILFIFCTFPFQTFHN